MRRGVPEFGPEPAAESESCLGQAADPGLARRSNLPYQFRSKLSPRCFSRGHLGRPLRVGRCRVPARHLYRSASVRLSLRFAARSEIRAQLAQRASVSERASLRATVRSSQRPQATDAARLRPARDRPAPARLSLCGPGAVGRTLVPRRALSVPQCADGQVRAIRVSSRRLTGRQPRVSTPMRARCQYPGRAGG